MWVDTDLHRLYVEELAKLITNLAQKIRIGFWLTRHARTTKMLLKVWIWQLLRVQTPIKNSLDI